MKKEKYQPAEMTVLPFPTEDVIVTSIPKDDGNTGQIIVPLS